MSDNRSGRANCRREADRQRSDSDSPSGSHKTDTKDTNFYYLSSPFKRSLQNLQAPFFRFCISGCDQISSIRSREDFGVTPVT